MCVCIHASLLLIKGSAAQEHTDLVCFEVVGLGKGYDVKFPLDLLHNALGPTCQALYRLVIKASLYCCPLKNSLGPPAGDHKVSFFEIFLPRVVANDET